MGLISIETVLGSAVVAALISGVVSLRVARSTAEATVKAARVAAREGRARAADEERRLGRDALVRAVEGWHMAALEDADWSVRQESAGKARAALIETATILGSEVRTEDLDRMLKLLEARNEEDLRAAADIWPAVQQTIMAAIPRLDVEI